MCNFMTINILGLSILDFVVCYPPLSHGGLFNSKGLENVLSTISSN